jgi:hypothetical protein
MDNAVLWMLYSLGQGGDEILEQRVAGLAALLGCSPHTVRDAIPRLTKAGLLLKRTGGFTLLEPPETVRSWWRDKLSKKKGGVTTQPGVILDTEQGDQLGWIESIVAERFGADSEDMRDLLACMMRKCSRQMLDGRVKPTDTKKYWQDVLELFPDCDKAWDFCNLGFTELWKDAYRTHASNGKYVGSCINLLTANTRTFLLTPWNDPLSLYG